MHMLHNTIWVSPSGCHNNLHMFTTVVQLGH